MIEQSEQIGELAEALSAAQAELRDVPKDQRANIPTNKGGTIRYAYADLSGVLGIARPVLAKHGLALVQVPEATAAGMCVHTRLLHKSGQWIGGSLTLAGDLSSARGAGSVITYARKYAVQAVIGICGEDDDGAASESRPTQRDQRSQPHVAPPAAAPASAWESEETSEDNASTTPAAVRDIDADLLAAFRAVGADTGGRQTLHLGRFWAAHGNGAAMPATWKSATELTKARLLAWLRDEAKAARVAGA